MIGDLFEQFNDVKNMIGTFYWEPTWIAAGNTTGCSTSQVTKWYNYGCGVATYAGATYLGWSGYVDGDQYNKAAGSATDEYSLILANGSAAASLAALNVTTDQQPLTQTRAQVSSVSSGYCALRFVGNALLKSTNDYDKLGFKIEYCTSSNRKSLYSNSTTTIYPSIKANGTTLTASDYSSSYASTDGQSLITTETETSTPYFYTYTLTKIPCDGTTYYFKVIPTATGSASYQQTTKYFKLTTTSTSATLDSIDAWEYIGSNANISSAMTSYSVYPSYMQ
jgi:hypothetical protein